MTNVTFLPWVNPEENQPVASPVNAGEATANSHDVPEGVSRLSAILFTEVEEPEEVSAAGLDLDALEQSLLRKLNSQDMSVFEVQQWLASKDAPEADAAELVAKCERLNYLNDERLAHELASRLSERNGKSKSVITRELRQRGISTALISAAVESIDDDDELHKATELALQRVRQFSRLDDVTAERRLVGFLSRRGYSGDIVRAACKQALSSRS
ncbi:regulatory protein RecX [Aurantimicrobium minutum]|uniref:Regulatory protein RecX n=1 Tax=Aurantimicrobium minutum TaxID=708131 RepID=A0A182C1N5_9MICO|nr:regulatory protein RecX [Aurantimicrobium minutum]BAU98907.1 regulatory protein RecX [Aurantimicrobium minutum]